MSLVRDHRSAHRAGDEDAHRPDSRYDRRAAPLRGRNRGHVYGSANDQRKGVRACNFPDCRLLLQLHVHQCDLRAGDAGVRHADNRHDHHARYPYGRTAARVDEYGFRAVAGYN